VVAGSTRTLVGWPFSVRETGSGPGPEDRGLRGQRVRLGGPDETVLDEPRARRPLLPPSGTRAGRRRRPPLLAALATPA
jgi:hypothetical protein